MLLIEKTEFENAVIENFLARLYKCMGRVIALPHTSVLVVAWSLAKF